MEHMNENYVIKHKPASHLINVLNHISKILSIKISKKKSKKFLQKLT